MTTNLCEFVSRRLGMCKNVYQERTVTHSQPLQDDPERVATLYLLALCLWREARGESFEGKAAVADVILNRVADPRWPDSTVGVITQRWQFSAFNANDPNVTKFPDPASNPAEWSAFVECFQVADQKLKEGPAIQADHYHTTSMQPFPKWTRRMRRVGVKGNHVFYDSKRSETEDGD